LLGSLEQLNNTNVQAEYYVTDCPSILLAEGKEVRALDVLKPCESLSINTMKDVQQVEAEMLRMQQSG
jgi:bifunctional UDP-N-acetylglucosamine pyrophosphorylase/glucosamine-1-phosphate N-acetyltransferase